MAGCVLLGQHRVGDFVMANVEKIGAPTCCCAQGYVEYSQQW